MLRIKGGRVYDPKNGWNGEIRDICIKDGKIVEDLPAAEEVIDATGLVVMAGGVDIHAHIAGPKVNTGRVICPEDHRRGSCAQNCPDQERFRLYHPFHLCHRLPLRPDGLHLRL